MQWLRSKPSSQISEIQSVEECSALMSRDLVILFKHSPSCPVSWMAHREVVRFHAGQPEAPVFLISVRERRDVAQFVARTTGVQHESPQIIVLRGGQLIGDASHDDVTVDLLTRLSTQMTENGTVRTS